MKRATYFVLLVLWLIPFAGVSQIFLSGDMALSDTLSYRQNFDHFITPLDKSQFTTGVLYDRVYPFAQLHRFSSRIPQDTSSYRHFVQAYHEISLASLDQAALKPFQELKKDVATHTTKGSVPIGILHYDFNYIDSTALSTNMLRIQNKQLVKGSNTRNSYAKQGEVLVASLLTNSLRSGENSLSLSHDFIITNKSSRIDRVEISSGSSSHKVILRPGGTKPFSIKGDKRVVVQLDVYLTSGKKFTAFSMVDIAEKTTKSIISWCDSLRLESNLHYLSQKGIADVLIYYSDCNNPQIKRPIVIFDGFDPGDARKGNHIYSLMNDEPFFLADNLRANGYDVIIVNFPNGADYIIRNAYAAERVIQWVNQNKVTTNKLVVIGPSMGGLITRYALARMEKTGQNHQTGLWVSFDSPHQGANIAIGNQYFLDFFGRAVNNASAQEGLDKINEPAAKQMLIDHYYKQYTHGWDYGKPQHHYFRSIFKNDLVSNGLPGSQGYPVNLRKVSLINGSGKGINQEGIDVPVYLMEMRKKLSLLLLLAK